MSHVIFVFSATAPMLPFLPLFARQLGLQSGNCHIYYLSHCGLIAAGSQAAFGNSGVVNPLLTC